MAPPMCSSLLLNTSHLSTNTEMAQLEMQLEKEKLCCSVCLDLMKDPVTIPCGHSYCRSCIGNVWDDEDQKEVYSCPQCRQTFSPRPALVRNTVLADLVEDKKLGLQAAPDVQNPSDPGCVECDFCTDGKLKAVKSCLQCLVSYCEQHLQPHFNVAGLKKHKLVDPSRKLQDSVCSRHNEVMKIFCRTDQRCICYLCSMDEHQGHETVSAAAEMVEKQKELGAGQEKIQQRLQQKVKDVKMLQGHMEAINQSADEAVKDMERIFTEAKQQIRSRQKAEVTNVNELQEKLEQEMEELRRRDTELEKLSQTEDHIQFLLSYSSLSRLREDTDLTGIRVHPLSFRDEAAATVSTFRDQLQNVLGEERIDVPPGEAAVEVLPPQEEPQTREDFLKHACRLTLDSSTAHRGIRLESRLEVKYVYNRDEKFLHPDRFTSWPQVLCRELLTGRCYWEVEMKWDNTWGWCPEVFVAVAYKDIIRNGDESAFGNNDKSWALQFSDDGYEFRHNSVRTAVSGPRSTTIGVYLDHRAGVLSFYSVDNSMMTLLHRVQTTFTQPVCPGLGLFSGTGSAEFREIDLQAELDEMEEFE